MYRVAVQSLLVDKEVPLLIFDVDKIHAFQIELFYHRIWLGGMEEVCTPVVRDVVLQAAQVTWWISQSNGSRVHSRTTTSTEQHSMMPDLLSALLLSARLHSLLCQLAPNRHGGQHGCLIHPSMIYLCREGHFELKRSALTSMACLRRATAAFCGFSGMGSMARLLMSSFGLSLMRVAVKACGEVCTTCCSGSAARLRARLWAETGLSSTSEVYVPVKICWSPS